MEVLNNMKKILVIQTAFLGDAILTLPMIEMLSKRHSNSSIDVIAIPSTAELFNASAYVNHVHVLEKRGKHKGLPGLHEFCETIRSEKYDLIFSPHRSARSAYITLMSGVRDTYGFDRNSFNIVYKNIRKYNPKHHEVRRNLELADCDEGGDSWKILPKIIIPDEDKTFVNKFLKQLNENDTIAIAPGSIWNTKAYPAEKYSEIVNILSGKKYNVVLIGSEKDKLLCDNIISGKSENIFSVAGKFSVVQSIELLRHCRLLISNDSAPTHMALCADIPVITIFCSTVPDFGFYPYNSGSRYLSFDDLKCKPCGIHGYSKCPIGTFECAYKLDIYEILNEADKILNQHS